MKFKDMSPIQQKAYLKAHPNSKFGKTASVSKPKPFKYSGRTASEKRRHKAFDTYFWSGR